MSLTHHSEICLAFEKAWQSGENPNIQAYLATCSDGERESLVVDLIELELRYREASGEASDVQTYLTLFPEFEEAIRSRFLTTLQHSSDGLCSTVAGERPEVVVSGLPRMVRQLGRYELRRRIGKGGFGEIWCVYDPQLRREVALKMPRRDVEQSASLRRSFVAEGRKAAQLQHAGIVRVYDAGEDQGHCYIVSELMTGGTLRDRINSGRMAIDTAVGYAIDLAEALQYAHSNGVIHRDIKPLNVLFGADGRPRISDFGLARLSRGDESVVEGQVVLGTPAYMSPEQAAGQSSKADARSDIFSLGMILFEMLSGRRPFGDISMGELLERQARGEYDPDQELQIEDCPAELLAVCRQALALRPGDRFQSAAELAAALQQAACEAPAPVAARRRMGQRLAVVATALAVLGFIAAYVVGGSGPSGLVSVVIDTEPAEANVTFLPLESATGRADPAKAVVASGGRNHHAKLLPGRYLVVAVVNDERFHEVYRTVPDHRESHRASPYWHAVWARDATGQVRLATVRIPTADVIADLKRFEGAPRFGVGKSLPTAQPVYWTRIPPFYAQPKRIDRASFEKLLGAKGFQILSSRFHAQPNESMAAFRAGGTNLNFISWDEATHLAELAGLRLLTEEEFEFAASQWLQNQSPSEDWLTTSCEWTTSWATSLPVGDRQQVVAGGDQERVVRGQYLPASETRPPTLHETLYRRAFVDHREAQANIGFRLGRSAKPRLRAEDFVGATTVALNPGSRVH